MSPHIHTLRVQKQYQENKKNTHVSEMKGPFMEQLSGSATSLLRRSSTRHHSYDGAPGFNGLNFPSIPFTPDSGVRTPPSSMATVETPSNSFVSVQYTVNALDDGGEDCLSDGMLFFLDAQKDGSCRINNNVIKTKTLVSLGQLNHYLFKSWQRVQTAYHRNDINARRFLNALTYVSEDAFCKYKADRDRGKKVEDDAEGTLKFLYDLCAERDDYAMCLCPQLIFGRFLFGGVIKVMDTPGRKPTISSIRHRAPRIATTAASGLVDCYDIFTPNHEIGMNSKLFLHLTRRETHDGNLGSFVIVPFACLSTTRPCVTNAYRQLCGASSNGLLTFVGTMIQPKDRKDAVVTKENASGVTLTGGLDHNTRAVNSLTKIWINLFH